MIISKARASVSAERSLHQSTVCNSGRRKHSAILDLQSFIEARDYTGAITLLQLKHLENVCDVETLEWLAYCHFHHGEHDKACDIYKQLLTQPNSKPIYHTYVAACKFYLAIYDEAEVEALHGPNCSLQIRILFHVAHKKRDEKALMQYHKRLGESVEDQLSLASFHYLQASYQDATDIYKRLLLEHRDWLALNVYVALCYYNLDFHDVSLEILNAYLQAYPDSAIAANLKACNNHKLWGGKVAATDLRLLKEPTKGLVENELLEHNLVVFRQGEGALQVLRRLQDIFAEAQLNLAIYHLHNNELQQAYEVIRKLEPTSPQEFIIKAVTCACLGQEISSEDLILQAQQLFQLVGSSASDCDTIPGRQSMASFYFLSKQFEDAIIYLKSIRNFCETKDEFKWNYGIAKASVGDYCDAEEMLSLISSEKFVEDYYYHTWLAYCLVMNGRAHIAWERYIQVEASDESYSLLQLIANECYRTGQFLVSAKAFEALVRTEDSEEHWEGLRGACVGVFEKIVMGKESEDKLEDILILLGSTSNPQEKYISSTMKKWAKQHLVKQEHL
ncbi:hypothetical protein GOP47_0022494 [Adiantum capillus-veneris]|uniref:Tetratricopeptide repeat protein 26 n=1 Tax=Adiantum capillus-veneris TaxID=13818 RepID=A0A9D4U5Y2_ADICA|nr:hypothetical protein GOP47_0022494 [Adiantum capillus-veneris]